MDRFNAFASQAKAKAEQGRTQLNSQLHKHDTPRPTSHNATPSQSSSGSGTFVGIDTAEREALFSLLDEYFTSRPQYADFFKAGGAAPAGYTPPAAAAAPPPPPVRRGLGTATASYDYAGAEADDLSFSEGDSITVLEKVSEDWWKGELRGKSGLFPAAYVAMD